MNFPSKDVSIIRDLAKRVAEVAALPEQAEKAELWRQHNNLELKRPLVLIFPEGSWREAMPGDVLQTTDPTCRGYERDLRVRLYHHEHLKDDNVISGTVHTPIVVHNSGYGVSAHTTRPKHPTGAAGYDTVISTAEDFFEKVRKPEVTVDWEESERRYEEACALFDGILPVEKKGGSYSGFAVVDLFSQWRGFGQLLLDLADRPEWLHRCLQFLTDCTLANLDKLEAEGALGLNNKKDYVGSGGVGYTDQLPQSDFDGTHVRTRDLWGFATAQIFSEVSPAMHEEFALRYEIQFLSRFGLNCYGCCEPLHLKMNEVRKIPRLRRVSMSPYVDLAKGAEEIGDQYIYSRKPNPAILASVAWNPDAVRKSTRDDLEKTRGCIVELIMKDTHTVNGEPHRLAEWVRIAKEEVDAFMN
jgi:hypothetical protein